MRFVFAAAFLAATPLSALAADVPATSAIDDVTVFLSGAEVTRIVKVHIERGEHTIVIGDVPASAVPGSVRVEGKATGKLDIGSVDTARKFLQRAESEAADKQRKILEDSIQALKDQKTTVDAQAQAAKTQKKLIANLAQLPSRSSAQAAPAATPLEDWPKVLALIAQATSDASKLALDAEQKIREIDRQISDAEKQLAALAPARTEQTEVRVHVVAQTPLEADLSIRYQVPDAHWAPLYDARLGTGSKTEPPKLSLDRRAAITQRSGENWDNVSLKLSTSRPSDSSSAPYLETQFVDFEQAPKPVAAAAPPPLSEPMPRMMAKHRNIAAADALGGALEQAAPESVNVEEAVAQLQSAPFEATFEVPGRASVAGTGEAKRVLLASEAIEPALSCRAVPKVDTSAYLYAKLKLAKGTPLLPGTVYLFRDGTFVGTGDLPLLSPGSEHDLGFGIDDQVKIKHAVLEEKRGESGLISTSHIDSRNFRVNVKNMHERAMDVTILDRIPVAQNDEIKVDLTGRVSPTMQNVDDKRGIIAFQAKLEPDEEKILEYGYRVSWPAAKSITYGP
ncbi:mucoidy inhibitor MuiA family protein [Hyphomicrobium sp.]|uniref:mucoidy inhibitor MuiA family protein n=1 Tax=Hyphomicrobium sp. TaxID=82 RepID=UPI001D709F82|nr:mucoidy inhibitor MuiA family protein [Hyphomicrobium sp.]MBY0561738.1 mucoidy inhibitor MuiA family protein [Hyphomicrobium sp.]